MATTASKKHTLCDVMAMNHTDAQKALKQTTGEKVSEPCNLNIATCKRQLVEALSSRNLLIVDCNISVPDDAATSEPVLVAAMRVAVKEAVKEATADFKRLVSDLREKTDKQDLYMVALQGTVESQRVELCELRDVVKTVQKQLHEQAKAPKAAGDAKLAQTVATLATEVKQTQQQLGKQAQDAEEHQERDKRAQSMVVLGLSESEGETGDVLAAQVAALQADVGASGIVPVTVMRMGKPRIEPVSDLATPNRFSALSSPSTRPRAVLVTFASVQDKQQVLKGRKRLAQSEKFSKVGLDDSLTKLQQQERGRLWLTFKELKDAGKKPYWRGEKLFVAGSVYTPPTSN
jgi:hypothetical protein